MKKNEFDLFNLIYSHYFGSTVPLHVSDSDLKSLALRELTEYFFNHAGERGFETYLQHNWCDNETCVFCGRHHDSKIAFSRTTMEVESHWSMIKSLYLLPNNHPSLYLLIRFIASGVMAKYKHDYKSMKFGRKKNILVDGFCRRM